MRIVVTGKAGQVVSSLLEAAAGRTGIEVITVGRPELDLTDHASVIGRITRLRPDVVISAAAYTAVDRAEDEPDLAYAVNVNGAAAVAEAAERAGAPVIHLSTDYVFAGDGSVPYDETCKAQPNTVYGWTKLKGEEAVAKANPRSIILRTSWVYSPFGTNFVKTMLRLAKDRPSISVVADQWGNPTSALDIADALIRIAANAVEDTAGTYHFSGSGETNWSGFARHIFARSKANGGPFADVIDIATADYPAKARRPANSRLCCAKAEATFGIHAPDWHDSTEIVVRRLLAAQSGI
jgi:dTDP-4-dehydrorhamnose reductase